MLLQNAKSAFDKGSTITLTLCLILVSELSPDKAP